MSLFYANYGINPEYEMIGHMINGKTTLTGEMHNLHKTLWEEILLTQLRQKELSDLYGKADPDLQSEDMIWLLP